MAGIYLHIPFCRQACYYCDFHFSTSLNNQELMIDAIIDEIELQKPFLCDHKIETIYFGGGTPSLLNEKQLNKLLNKIHATFNVGDNTEITLEANPDDLSREKLIKLKSGGINRLSIGIQSFYQPHLTYLNRIHSNDEATNCVINAKEIGFANISIDLIYGIPFNNHDVWLNDIEQALKLNIQHISAYCLTIEEKTVFGNWLNKGKIKQVEDEFAATQFEMLINKLTQANFEQYEVSNFSLPNFNSRHNSSYWLQKIYLGVGPGAHSYNGQLRQYNVSNNPNYIKSIKKGVIPFTVDELTYNDRINERILISLRTKWGLDMVALKNELEYDIINKKRKYIEQLVRNGLGIINDSTLILSTQGMLLADHISTELFID